MLQLVAAKLVANFVEHEFVGMLFACKALVEEFGASGDAVHVQALTEVLNAVVQQATAALSSPEKLAANPELVEGTTCTAYHPVCSCRFAYSYT